MTPEAAIIESMFKIANKQGELVPFILNGAQRSLDNNLGLRNVITKSRQQGISAVVLARFLVACLHKPNTRAVVISHEKEATERMLHRVHQYLKHLPMGAKLGHSSKGEITFPKTDSMFYIGTAGSKEFARGDTITHFHGSEVAFWENPTKLLKGALQAVPTKSGEVFLESTGNGTGNWFHNTAKKAYANMLLGYKFHFFSWQTDPECWIDLTAEQIQNIVNNPIPEYKELELLAQFPNLTPQQLAFRRYKIGEMDDDLQSFMQEYPSTYDECFQSSSRSLFPKVTYSNKDWSWQGGNNWALADHPRADLSYIVGADPSGGVGLDDAVAQVICLETFEQVASYVSDTTGPDIFGERLVEMAKRYNNAYIVVESNNHGVVTLKMIQQSGYPDRLIHVDDNGHPGLAGAGCRTTARTKPLLIGNLRTALAEGLTIHCEATKDELSTFVETDSGRLEAASGCQDNRVMALAMCWAGWNEASRIFAKPITIHEPNPLNDINSLDSILASLDAKSEDYPIPHQNEGSHS